MSMIAEPVAPARARICEVSYVPPVTDDDPLAGWWVMFTDPKTGIYETEFYGNNEHDAHAFAAQFNQ